MSIPERQHFTNIWLISLFSQEQHAGKAVANSTLATSLRVNGMRQLYKHTNKIESLDPAVLRPGRIDRKIEFPLPDIKTRRRIFRIHTSRMTLADDVSMEEFVMNKDEFSGADIKAICTKAGLLALRERCMKKLGAGRGLLKTSCWGQRLLQTVGPDLTALSTKELVGLVHRLRFYKAPLTRGIRALRFSDSIMSETRAQEQKRIEETIHQLVESRKLDQQRNEESIRQLKDEAAAQSGSISKLLDLVVSLNAKYDSVISKQNSDKGPEQGDSSFVPQKLFSAATGSVQTRLQEESIEAIARKARQPAKPPGANYTSTGTTLAIPRPIQTMGVRADPKLPTAAVVESKFPSYSGPGDDGIPVPQPVALLDRRLVKYKGKPATQTRRDPDFFSFTSLHVHSHLLLGSDGNEIRMMKNKMQDLLLGFQLLISGE
ncbi:hypothetical protein Vadar_020222 [Vaccinium darrowii]|uniref:Uncharacterized protein n=1 Tax=Vaccinium darrowii TaxID=229202 RepID=A0ACB7Z561_9ERIC|nr:hypothetical protein Vadar_020222 [Vaccinium darrowii]